MEPINNQQLNLTQMQSPVLQTAQQTPPIPSVSVQPQFMPQQPAMKNNSKKLILLLVILSLMIGIVVYIMFAKNAFLNFDLYSFLSPSMILILTSTSV